MIEPFAIGGLADEIAPCLQRLGPDLVFQLKRVLRRPEQQLGCVSGFSLHVHFRYTPRHR